MPSLLYNSCLVLSCITITLYMCPSIFIPYLCLFCKVLSFYPSDLVWPFLTGTLYQCSYILLCILVSFAVTSSLNLLCSLVITLCFFLSLHSLQSLFFLRFICLSDLSYSYPYSFTYSCLFAVASSLNLLCLFVITPCVFLSLCFLQGLFLLRFSCPSDVS